MEHELFIIYNGLCCHNPAFNGSMYPFSHVQGWYPCSISNDKKIVPVVGVVFMKKIIIVSFGVMGYLFYQGKL